MDRPARLQLDAEIAQLRAQFPRTADLYREVCVLLFFRYGITPTANKLYQLVKKGSMSAPADALAAFWATLRDKSRVRIESPDLPDEIKGALGELAIAIWDRAQASAQEALTGFRSDASQEADQARAAQATAETEVARLRQELSGSAALAGQRPREGRRARAASGGADGRLRSVQVSTAKRATRAGRVAACAGSGKKGFCGRTR